MRDRVAREAGGAGSQDFRCPAKPARYSGSHAALASDVLMSVGTPPFQVFLDEHREDVYSFLVASVGPQEADDCFQETFVSALRAYPKLRANSNLRAWVLTIAHNKALDNHRARGRRPVPVEDAGERGSGNTPSPQEGLENSELWEAVRELPAKQRGAIVLRYANDLAHAEIARVLDCSEEAARRNVHEGVRKLREVWK
jgi:RNA polymerase sigma factor (sigma-70 family)